MRPSSWLIAIASAGVLVFSCGGEEFGNAGPGQADAGESGSDVGAGGSPATEPEGGRSGSDTTGGGVPGDQGGSGSGGRPDTSDCSSEAAPEVPGDCQKLVCTLGKLTTEPDPKDVPEPRGACDVPLCKDGQPTFDSDPSQCKINQLCGEGQCSCAGCPNGKVPALSSTLCRLPAMVSVAANKTNTGSAASHAADGDAETTWNSGDLDGVLTITPASPQAMMAIVVWVAGSTDNDVASDQKLIQVHASVETAAGVTTMKSGSFNFAQMSTGPVRLDLALVRAKKITLTFASPTSWISVKEVVFEICQ